MSRDAKLILLACAVATLCLAVVTFHVTTTTGPPVPVVEARVASGPDQALSVQFLGDTMLGDAALPLLRRHGYDWAFRDEVKAALDADYVIANLETSVTAHPVPFDPGKQYFYAASPRSVPAMRRANIDAVSLANNHAFDAGPTGLAVTLRHADEASMAAVGAGANLARAQEPLMVRSDAGTVAIVGLGENFGSSRRADDVQAGTVVLSPETVQRGVDSARAAGADWVVAFVHWGDNYQLINDQQRYWAGQLADAGYDLVVGSGPHIAQPIELVHGVPVVFSVGNFVFGSNGRFESYGQKGLGLIVTATFETGTGPLLAVRCLVTNNERTNFRPRLCSTAKAHRFLPTINPDLVLDEQGGYLQTPSRPDGNGS